MFEPRSTAVEAPNAGETFAAIDLGSNSFRLEIGRIDEGRYRRVDYLKEPVRLGGGLDADGRLSAGAAERGLACLRGFAARLTGFERHRVRAVATQTLREAANRDEFLARAQAAIGLPVDVISGREEARLIYVGVARMEPSPLPRLVVDIGGRSTEVILGRGLQTQAAESFAIGCVGISMRFFGDGRLGAAEFEAAQVAAGAEFEEAGLTFESSRFAETLGSSGTASAVSQLLVAAGRSADGSITRADVAWAIGRCIAAGRIDRIDLPGLKADRRPVIAGGLAILSAAMAQFGIESLRPTAGALRHGVIFELHDRSGGGEQAAAIDELRERSVADLQRRFEVDPAQAVRVRRVALALFAQVLPDAEADPRQELGWAAALHEVGLIVSHHDHHRHSAYLVGKADAAGFSQSEQRRLAALVLGQRGGLRKVEALLTQPAGALALLCLRLAVIICHPRADPDAGALRLRLRGSGAVEIRLDTAWARAHPRTRYLLGEEAAAWDRAGALRLQLAQ